MKATLLLAHGSRQSETVKTMNSITEKVKQITGDDNISCAFMQFAQPDLEQGLLELTRRGATHIQIVPYFLFDGVHIHEDIPELMRKFVAEHPGVTLSLGKTLGDDDRLAAIVADRVRVGADRVRQGNP